MNNIIASLIGDYHRVMDSSLGQHLSLPEKGESCLGMVEVKYENPEKTPEIRMAIVFLGHDGIWQSEADLLGDEEGKVEVLGWYALNLPELCYYTYESSVKEKVFCEIEPWPPLKIPSSHGLGQLLDKSIEEINEMAKPTEIFKNPLILFIEKYRLERYKGFQVLYNPIGPSEHYLLLSASFNEKRTYLDLDLKPVIEYCFMNEIRGQGFYDQVALFLHEHFISNLPHQFSDIGELNPVVPEYDYYRHKTKIYEEMVSHLGGPSKDKIRSLLDILFDGEIKKDHD